MDGRGGVSQGVLAHHVKSIFLSLWALSIGGEINANQWDYLTTTRGLPMWITIPDYRNYEVNDDRRAGILVRRKKLPRTDFSGRPTRTFVPASMMGIVNHRYHLTHHENRQSKSHLAERIYNHAVYGEDLLAPEEK